MARISARPPAQVILDAKGHIDFYQYRGIWCARAWPRTPTLPRSQAVQASASLFARAAYDIANMDPSLRPYYRSMVTAIPWTWKDAATYLFIRGTLAYDLNVNPDPADALDLYGLPTRLELYPSPFPGWWACNYYGRAGLSPAIYSLALEPHLTFTRSYRRNRLFIVNPRWLAQEWSIAILDPDPLNPNRYSSLAALPMAPGWTYWTCSVYALDQWGDPHGRSTGPLIPATHLPFP